MLGNVHLLLCYIAGKPYGIHPVQKGGRNGIQRIGRGDEEHLSQIQGQIKVVVEKLIVLFGIQDLEKG